MVNVYRIPTRDLVFIIIVVQVWCFKQENLDPPYFSRSSGLFTHGSRAQLFLSCVGTRTCRISGAAAALSKKPPILIESRAGPRRSVVVPAQEDVIQSTARAGIAGARSPQRTAATGGAWAAGRARAPRTASGPRPRARVCSADRTRKRFVSVRTCLWCHGAALCGKASSRFAGLLDRAPFRGLMKVSGRGTPRKIDTPAARRTRN
jgi:hypothetical protein